jgi:hypothetical protein
MNRYTFTFRITPEPPVGYASVVPPFDLHVSGTVLALKVTADAADERQLRERAEQAARNFAASLSYILAERFEIQYQSRHVVLATGQQSISATVKFEVRPADFEERAASEKRERERKAAQQHIADLTRRGMIDANLQAMLERWSRYIADPERRLNPLYDVLEIAERLYGGRRNAAVALSVSEADLNDLGRISNDSAVLNGRHPGKSPGPHRIATEFERTTCERVARALIESQAAKTVI